MHYSYTPPSEAKHRISWELHDHPGLFTSPRKTYSAKDLVPELVTWLDANAPGWSLSSDWDGFSCGGDLYAELSISDEKQAHGFLAEARRISREWEARDRDAMPYRLEIETVDGKRIEIGRGHSPVCALNHQRELGDHVRLDEQPWRAEFFRAVREVEAEMAVVTGPYRASPIVRDGTYLTKGSRLFVSRITVPS